MIRLFIISALFFFFLVSNVYAVQRTISWERVTTYTDGTLIEAEKIIYYDITMRTGTDNVLLVNGSVDNSYVFEHDNANQDHIFNGRARLNTGEASEWSPDFLWHCPPAGTPSTVPEKPIILGPIRRP